MARCIPGLYRTHNTSHTYECSITFIGSQAMLLDKKKVVCKYPACTTGPGIASFLFMGQNARPATSVYVNTFHPWRSPPGTFRGTQEGIF